MTTAESWVRLADWFESYASQEGCPRTSFFPKALNELASRGAAQVLYVRRWATTAVVSRFGTHPDWASGPGVELTPLHNGRIKISAFRAYGVRVERWTVSADLQDARLGRWPTYISADGLSSR
jgi:hypothetical protein